VEAVNPCIAGLAVPMRMTPLFAAVPSPARPWLPMWMLSLLTAGTLSAARFPTAMFWLPVALFSSPRRRQRRTRPGSLPGCLARVG
jgi:hypothetical protein